MNKKQTTLFSLHFDFVQQQNHYSFFFMRFISRFKNHSNKID